MKSYLQKIKTKLHLETPLKAVHLLDGAYEAVVKGQSMDFDELRAYSPGDRRKDIDWKSSARANNLLVKQYVAQKRMPVEFVIDTGLNMKGLAPSGEEKHVVALDAAGLLAYVALNHNDTVGFVTGDSGQTEVSKQTSSPKMVEVVLNEVADGANTASDVSSVVDLLDVSVSSSRARKIVVVISGSVTPDSALSDIIRRTKTKNDLLWVIVEDINPFLPTSNVVDVETKTKLPVFLKKNKKLQQVFETAEQEREKALKVLFEKENVPFVKISSTDTVLDSIISLLLARKHGKY